MATLPILQYEEKIIETVGQNPVVVVIGETGSGKSTQLSQMLLRRGYGKIAVTQPRRVAAVTVARRVAQELDVQLGEEVGYAIRFEDRTSHKTRIKYLTDGVLLREILANPELNEYSVIILDEAHERSLNTDILMGLMKRLVKVHSSDLKVLITSATLDGDQVSKFFADCPVLTVPGKLYPVEVLYSKERPSSYLDSSLKTALDIHLREPEGDILIFVTGQDDIEKLVSKLEDKVRALEEGSCMDAIILPLHDSLPPELQLHGQMCKALSIIYCKVLSIFPSVEAARPRSITGIQALCSLHVALEKAKNVLQHCSESSKLYLAITGDSVLLTAILLIRFSLTLTLVQEIVIEFVGMTFTLDPSEKQVGDDLIALLQEGRKFNEYNDSNELESFHQAATRLGITSSRAALAERRALKKLIERARAEEHKRKESIVAYLLHLMRKYSKLFRNEFSDDNDSQGSAPCSPTVQGAIEEGIPGGHCQAFDRQLSKFNSFNSKANNNKKSGQMPLPPEELRCLISLQLMYDPVIIASGQTYERVCIEKWFSNGHDNCPKTQQKLSHLCLTPNYYVKGLVASWCEQNGVSLPEGPPESLDINYWRLLLSESECCCKLNIVNVVPLEESGISEESRENETECVSAQEEDTEQYFCFLKVLTEGNSWKRKCEVVEQLRTLLRDDEEARIFMGANGFVEALLLFLQSAMHEGNLMAQESGAMALFNLAVNNNRNKEIMLSAEVLSLLEEMISNRSCHSCATALYLNLSCLEEAKPMIGMSLAVQFLIQLLQSDYDVQCKQDSLHALYNLSTLPSNIPYLLSAGIINGLQSLLVGQGDCTFTEICVAILINLATSQDGREEMVSVPGLISTLASILDTGELLEQEQAASCLLILCNTSEKCCEMVLQEGVIPALVSISVNGTPRGREKAQKLLMLFREQRQRDHSPVETHQCSAETSDLSMPPPEMKPLCKSMSRKKSGTAFGFFWKSKTYSVYRC